MGFTFAVGAVTGAFGLISFIGSVLIIASYIVTVRRTGTTPKSARLIFYLAMSDLIWFLAAVILGSVWMAQQDVSRELCFVIGPILTSTRISSLLWTSVIAFDVLQSVKKRKWRWKGSKDMETKYFVFVYALSLPCAIMLLVKQVNHDRMYGCAIEYEPLGPEWAIVMFEIVPLLVGFMMNVGVYMFLRSAMSSAFPQSVRERRRQMMYHYVLVGIVCWLPTMMHYILSIIPGMGDLKLVTLFARATLYSSGFLNFLVYGMQDRYLRRAFANLFCPNDDKETAAIKPREEKTVMFNEATLLPGANIPKGKKDIYYFNRLSPDDKEYLYEQRPDLNMSAPLLESQTPSAANGDSDHQSRISEATSRAESQADKLPSKRRNTGLFSELMAPDDYDSSESDSDDAARAVNYAGSTPPVLGGDVEAEDEGYDFSPPPESSASLSTDQPVRVLTMSTTSNSMRDDAEQDEEAQSHSS